MASEKHSIEQIEKVGAVSGILSIIFYFSVAVMSFIPDRIALLIAFTFPLLWIISFMGIHHFLKKERHTVTLEIGYVFAIIGSALVLTLLVVQQANFIWHEEALAGVESDAGRDLLKAAFRGANRVQAGMDVAFDIFITVGWFLIGLNIAKSSSFNRILGWTGRLIAAGLLTLNMITFPTAPAEAGLIDLGPFLGIWALVFFTWFLVVVFRRKKFQPE